MCAVCADANPAAASPQLHIQGSAAFNTMVYHFFCLAFMPMGPRLFAATYSFVRMPIAFSFLRFSSTDYACIFQAFAEPSRRSPSYWHMLVV